MPKINRYVDISTVDREAKKDLIDRHSPFITAPESATAGEMFKVTVKVGNEYAHPDDFDHYVASLSLFNGQTLLATSEFKAGMLGGQGHKGHAEVTFNVLATGRSMRLNAQAYCTKHGIWECDVVKVKINPA